MNTPAASLTFLVSPFLSATCSLLESDGECLIVDPGLDVAEDLRSLIERRGIAPVGILLSHGHLDHVADASALAAGFDLPVYVGADDEYRLDNPVEQLPSAFTASVAPVLEKRGWKKPARTVAVSEDATVTVGAVTLTAWSVPGHTEGSTIFVTDSPVQTEPSVGVCPRAVSVPGVAFTGDVLFAGTIGRTDLPGGNPEDMKASLRRLRQEAVQRAQHLLVPGHGPVTTFGDELANNGYLSVSL